MISPEELKEIKSIIESLLQKMTLNNFSVHVKEPSAFAMPLDKDPLFSEKEGDALDTVDIVLTLDEPQIMIGQGGQTLLNLQYLLRILVVKKIKKPLRLRLDVNDYLKKKEEHLKIMAREAATEVAFTKKPKHLPPMSAYERRIIHTELQGRPDVATQSRNEGEQRYVVISPK